MKLWLLCRHEDEPTWDVADGFVVRAETEEQARAIAAKRAGDEGSQVWLRYSAGSTCEELTADGEPGIILRDYNAG